MPLLQQRAHKVIITGTGRAGTTFLVRILTELGLDTGITRKNWDRKYFPQCNAGLEHNLMDPETPYIVKNPALCETLPEALATGRFAIDHVYIPIRKLEDAVASRIVHGGEHGSVPGGLWRTADPSSQRAVLAEHFHHLVHVLAENEIPHTFILFPRMIEDPGYTFRKLAFLLGTTSRGAFDAVFDRIADRSLVHDFSRSAPVGPVPVPEPAPVVRRNRLGLFGSARTSGPAQL